MILFLLTFFSLYGSLHLYIFFKIRGALALGTVTILFVVFFMAIMVSAPVIVRVAEKHEFELSARFISHLGYTWMGVAFLFFAFSLVFDLYRLLIYTSELIVRTNFAHLAPSSLMTFMIKKDW